MASTPGGDDAFDHTAAITPITARGKFFGTIDTHEFNAAALEKLKRLIGQS